MEERSPFLDKLPPKDVFKVFLFFVVPNWVILIILLVKHFQK